MEIKVIEERLDYYTKMYQMALVLFGEDHQTTLIYKVASNILLETKEIIEHERE